jgi:hypothetical protein
MGFFAGSPGSGCQAAVIGWQLPTRPGNGLAPIMGTDCGVRARPQSILNRHKLWTWTINSDGSFPHIIFAVNHGNDRNAPRDSWWRSDGGPVMVWVVTWRGSTIIMELTARYYFILFYCVLSVDNNKPVDNLWTKCVFLYFLLTRNLIITSY